MANRGEAFRRLPTQQRCVETDVIINRHDFRVTNSMMRAADAYVFGKAYFNYMACTCNTFWARYKCEHTSLALRDRDDASSVLRSILNNESEPVEHYIMVPVFIKSETLMFAPIRTVHKEDGLSEVYLYKKLIGHIQPGYDGRLDLSMLIFDTLRWVPPTITLGCSATTHRIGYSFFDNYTIQEIEDPIHSSKTKALLLQRLLRDNYCMRGLGICWECYQTLRGTDA